MFFAPSSWSSWISYVSGILAFAANITLGMSAGIGGNAAVVLEKPGMRDNIDCQVEMKRRTRRRLRKFLASVLLVLGILSGLPQVAEADETVWAWAIDVSDSMDPVQREEAISGMIEPSLPLPARSFHHKPGRRRIFLTGAARRLRDPLRSGRVQTGAGAAGREIANLASNLRTAEEGRMPQTDYRSFWDHRTFAVVGHTAKAKFPRLTYRGLKKMGKVVFARFTLQGLT